MKGRQIDLYQVKMRKICFTKASLKIYFFNTNFDDNFTSFPTKRSKLHLLPNVWNHMITKIVIITHVQQSITIE